MSLKISASKWAIGGFTIVTLVCLGAFQNCSKVSFNPESASLDAESAGSGAATSTATPASSPSTSVNCTAQQANNLRIIFVVDDSGSTRTDDSGAKVRGTAALDFINQNLSATNMTYSYNYFAANNGSWDFSSSSFTSTASTALPKQAFGSGSQAVTAVNNFVKNYNGSFFQENGTDYESSLQYVQNLVLADEAANPGYNYAVIFMSDGQPNRGSSNSTNLSADIAALMNAAGEGRLTLSTVYFNNSQDGDSGEASLMQSMATAGEGQYVNAVTDSSSLNVSSMIQNLLTVPSNACNE